ncbi:MAG: hypothetical protein ACE5KI_04365, partial [Dehalococcoidia bacterium]
FVFAGPPHPPTVYANGGVDVRTVVDEQVGPYYLFATASPATPEKGIVHFTFTLTDFETAELVTDAFIELIGTPPREFGSDPISFIVGVSEMNPDNYDADASLDGAGDWAFSVLIDGPLGPAETDFTLNVAEGGRDLATVLIVVLVFSVLLAALYGWTRRRQRRITDRRPRR